MLTQDPPPEGGHLVFRVIYCAAKRITIIINLVGVGGCTPRRLFLGREKGLRDTQGGRTKNKNKPTP